MSEPVLTAFRAFERTRGLWGPRDANSRRACPVCGEAVDWPDHRRIAHLRVHLRQGWRPPEPGSTAPPEATA